MATRYIQFASDEFYHVYNRGVDKRIIYEEPQDYLRFQELLYISNTQEAISLRNAKRGQRSVYGHDRTAPLVSIGAYCLMPNHFHVLLTPEIEGGVSTFMSKITTGYAMYFNKKYSRSGTLFEGTFKAQHVDSDEYLKYLFSYIHLNPLKLVQSDWKEAGITDAPRAYDYATHYEYSSLVDYFNSEREEEAILHKERYPAYFTDSTELTTELFDWIEFTRN